MNLNIIKRIIKGILRPIAKPYFNRIRIILREELTHNNQHRGVSLNNKNGYSVSTINAKPSTAIKTVKISTFAELDAFCDKYNRGDYDGLSFRDFLGKHYISVSHFFKLYGSSPPKCDPFSDVYKDWEIGFFKFLYGREYSFNNEGVGISNYDKPPTYAHDLDKRVFSLRLYADFLNIVKPISGMNIIEMGCGAGDLLELLGRCGCIVTGLDVNISDEGFANYVKNRLTLQNIKASVIAGDFFQLENISDLYDLIIFEASFHHCNDPVRLMRLLYIKLKPGGRIIFFREPFSNRYDRPWGVTRYDGMTMYFIRARGHMDFAHRNDFFEELLLRTGFSYKKHVLFDSSELYDVCKL